MKLLSVKGRRPLFTLRVYKRHILIFMAAVAVAIIVYAAYFRTFMTLPQSAINVLQEAPFDLNSQKVLIIAPHCDDEALGAAGLIQRAREKNSEVAVVVVTDCNKRRNGQARQDETINALSGLGVARSDVSFLGFPEDQDRDNNANNEQNSIEKKLEAQITLFDPTIIVLPHPSDTHIDHRLSSLAGIAAIRKANSGAQVVYYLIHYNFLRYPSPPGLRPDNYLLPPARLITLDEKWYKFSLTEVEENNKEDAILKYKTQLRRTNPILYRILLDFVRQNELFMIESK